MWDIRRGVDAEQFPDERVVVQIMFTDAPGGWSDWWLISEDRDVDLCLEDPGHEVDLCIRCRLKALTAVWLCQRTLQEAERAGDLEVLGNPELRKQLPLWLQGSPLARLGEASLRENPVAH
jgi:hypothetical protein